MRDSSFFKMLADNSPLFIGMCDLAYNPFYVNEAGRKLVGLDDLAHFAQTQVADFFFPEDQSYILNEFFPRVMREGRAQTEIRFRHFKTGEAIWMTYDVFSLSDDDGNPAGFATVSRDITESKQAEAALRASEERYRTLFTSLDDLRRRRQAGRLRLRRRQRRVRTADGHQEPDRTTRQRTRAIGRSVTIIA